MDLDNSSDFESLLNMIDDEEYAFERKEENSCIHSAKEEETDCEIISVKSSSIRSISHNLSTSLSATLNRLPPTAKKVQKSISEFFRTPKRVPEVDATELKEEKMAKKPFTFPPVHETKSTKNTPIFGAASKNLAVDNQISTSKYKLPRFKLIPGTRFAVDAFCYGPLDGITGYFLTHFHSDHYKGLTNKLLENSSTGCRLYCSQVTGNLVQKQLKIREEFITILEIGQIYSVENCKVGVLDANQ
jgi:hypothetical protein